MLYITEDTAPAGYKVHAKAVTAKMLCVDNWSNQIAGSGRSAFMNSVAAWPGQLFLPGCIVSEASFRIMMTRL
jgi:hypothetical protein